MRRRNIIGLVAGLVLISGQPAAPAAPERIRHVVVLFPMPKSDPQFGESERLLRSTLVKHGWAEGRNLVLTFASVGREPSQIDPLLPAILTPEPDVIVSRSTAVALALHRRSQRTPVVFTRVADPVGLGLVATLQKPGGTMTGLTGTEPSMGRKWVGLLREIAPDLKRVAFLMHAASSPIAPVLAESIEQVSASLGLEAVIVPLRERSDLEPAFARLAALGDVGILVSPGAFTLETCPLIATLAARHRIPAVYPYRPCVTAGGLASYGSDESVWFQQASDYVDRILRGAHPGDLPVQAPSQLSFILNARAAAGLGIAVTPALLARADEILD
ncbi:ABC transporter substrate-binding protein [Methylobacterium sp. E-065]|uniref:ABC transporter substrate-binding protein n=1 Tax=Methylobacterium sp. E-065 TaxID=2836583 RepID=UPI001FBB240E|nr:ABC transporter substrate-binding protein [Methylobacterium sp. E-065]MCJ2022404.1 ABC transporter substrate-binding protein [Methylobacterium sp. E-065]